MHLRGFLAKTSDLIDGITMKLVIGLVLAMLVIITLQILSRTLAQAFTWTEELSRYLLVWSTFLAATLAYKRGLHIAVTLVADAFPAKIRRIIIFSGYLLSLFFFVLGIYYGITLMALQIFQLSPALLLPMRWVYLVIPLAFTIMSIHAAAALAALLSGDDRR
jgi:TRAP-type C4-dicarboxylate transport system permease small subunit